MKAFQPFKIFSFLTLVALVSSCATSSSNVSNPCRHPNWYRLGYNDGANGKNKKDLESYYATCAAHVVINKSAYDKGWKTGVAMYCTSRNGLKLGMEGKLYNNVCPDNQISAFDKSWHEGIIAYCTAENGYERGLQGRDFPGFCPPYANLTFKKFYQRGRRIYLKLKVLKDRHTELNTKVQALETDIKTREKTLEALQRSFAQEAFHPGTQYKIQKDKIRIKHLVAQMSQLIQERDTVLQKYTALVKQFAAVKIH